MQKEQIAQSPDSIGASPQEQGAGGGSLRTWLRNRENRIACLLFLLLLILHLAAINIPGEVIFDEGHYIPEARSILEGGGTLHSEHPPLGKLLNAAGILLLGDRPLGWRIFPVLLLDCMQVR